MGRFFLVLVSGILLGAASAGAAVLVAPNANANASGDAQGPAPFSFFGSSGSHDQIVYNASQFGSFGGAQNISSIQFRPYTGSSISGFIGGQLVISNVTISLSTTTATEQGANGLSATYSSNVGANSKIVYSGPLTLTTTDTLSSNGVTNNFDYNIPLQNVFSYNPSLGNLLLDVNIPVGATVTGTGFGFVTFDQVNDAGDGVGSVLSSGTPGTTGTLSTSAPVTQFTFGSAGAGVPEPASLSLISLGVGALLLRRKRS